MAQSKTHIKNHFLLRTTSLIKNQPPFQNTLIKNQKLVPVPTTLPTYISSGPSVVSLKNVCCLFEKYCFVRCLQRKYLNLQSSLFAQLFVECFLNFLLFSVRFLSLTSQRSWEYAHLISPKNNQRQRSSRTQERTKILGSLYLCF